MRTRAFLYILLGYLILAALLAGDLVAHGYRALQGVSFELFRAILQGIALSWLFRGAYTLFFRQSPIGRAGDDEQGVVWPIRLVRRFLVVFGVSLALSFLPSLFRLSVDQRMEPTTFPTVISLDFLGAIWLTSIVAVTLSFWQIAFLRQQTQFARRRFSGWVAAVAAFSLVFFLSEENVLTSTIGPVLIGVLGIIVGLGAVLLGYRLPWVPHVPRGAKRSLIWLSLACAILAALLGIMYGGSSKTAGLFDHYAVFWHAASGALYLTLTIYFSLVFFSALFSLSSSELVERKSAEVKSLVKLTRFSSDVLTSELLLDLPRLAEQITTLAREATGSDCAWLELRSNTYAASRGRSGELVIRSQVGIDEQSAERMMAGIEHFPEAANAIRSPREELETTHKPFLIRKRRATSLASLRDPIEATPIGIHSLVAVPLIRKDEVRGGLYVAKKKEDGFDDDDLTVLTAFSDVASLALETARLVADSIEKQKFDGELRAARAMQKSLLPEHFPDVPGFEIDAISIPAYDVGGDYYDTTVLWDGSPVVVIGDVSGKGISASMYMAETKGIVQGMAPLMRTMPELLEGANSALLRNSPTLASMRRSFVTLGMLNLRPEGVRYCRAGHTPLLVVRASGTYEFLQPKGMAVGLMRQTLFNQMLEESLIEVGAGDVVVLFSDGITDARNALGEEFGYTRLAEIVTMLRNESSARRITLEVLERVTNFVGSQSFGDDATLVVIKGLRHL